MIRHRSDRQVLTSAAQIDVALGDGLGPGALRLLVRARACWHEAGPLPASAFTVRLRRALMSPAAARWDEVFVAAARRRAAELAIPLPDPKSSVRRPNVPS